jgi:hypothetical protein
MKRYNSRTVWGLLIALPLLVTSLGCKKFLDRKPLTQVFSDIPQGGLEGRVFGLYNILRGYAGFSSLPWIDFHSIRDDDALKGSDANDGAEIITEFELFQYTKDDWATNTYWNDHFYMINEANFIIDSFKKIQNPDPATIRNAGEACFFAAYSYFELVKAYGEVPLFNFYITTPQEGIKDKSPIPAIYQFIDSCLQVAASTLPLSTSEYGPGFDGRLTRGAANTLWAQTYLFRQDWARVVALCNEVINSNQYRLLDDFSEVWIDGVDGVGKNSDESIWEAQCFVGENAQSNSAVYYGNFWGTSQQVRQNGASIEWNLGWGWNVPSQKLEDDFPDDDPRKRKTILYSGQFDGGPSEGGHGATVPAYTNPDGQGGLAQPYWSKKVYTGNSPAMRQWTGYTNNNGGEAGWINHRILRYADVILMLAEASNELDDGDTAEDMLELIRNRASGNLGPARTVVPFIPFTSKAQMRQAIKNERRWEFAMEGYRFYDLVRWGDAVAELGSLGYTNRCRFYPIPQQAINLSGNVLTQNPEWP